MWYDRWKIKEASSGAGRLCLAGHGFRPLEVYDMERITVTISDMEFTLLSEESRDYVEKVAKLVDEKMLAVGGGEGMSTLNAAILAAVNLADEYYKSVDSAENLRVQLKEYFDETSKLKNELSELRREMAKIKGVK